MRLFAPEGATEANVEGAVYKPDAEGCVEVQVPSHEATLIALGFSKTKPVPPAPPSEVHADDDEGRAAAAAASEGGPILTIRVPSLYPAIAAALEAAGIPFEIDETATDVLTLIDNHVGQGGGFGGAPAEPYGMEKARFPFVAACLDDAGVDTLADLDQVFAAIEKRAPADAFNDDGSRKEFVLGDFVKRALESAGLTDLSDTQAVLDAVEEAFVPFAAFDPDGDNKPGGTAPAAETDPDAIPAEIDALKGPELKKQLEDLGVAVPSGMAVPKMKAALRDELAKKAAEAANAPDAGA